MVVYWPAHTTNAPIPSAIILSLLVRRGSGLRLLSLRPYQYKSSTHPPHSHKYASAPPSLQPSRSFSPSFRSPSQYAEWCRVGDVSSLCCSSQPHQSYSPCLPRLG